MPALQPQHEVLDMLATYVAQRMTTKGFPSSTPGGNYGHGPGGLFANPALSQGLFSAVVAQPYSGIQFALPVRTTVYENPLDGIITGVTASSGSNATGVCDDPPSAGFMKLCEQSYPLGRLSLQTTVYDYSRGTRFNSRGEHNDFQVFGGPLANAANNPLVPTLPSAIGAATDSEVAKIMFAFAVNWSTRFAPLIYTGNPVSNNTAGGGYKEFWGLQKLINTGYQDAQTGQACPAADSIVRSFGNQIIGPGSTAAINTAITNGITATYFELITRAGQTNMNPVQWVLTMPYSLFYALTEIWPIMYQTVGATTIPTGSTNFVSASEQVKMRDDMRGDLSQRTGQYLLILGQKVPVILDDANPETRVAGDNFSASMYFVPLMAAGQMVTYLEFFDYNAANVQQADGTLTMPQQFRTTDGGKYLLHMKPAQNFCVQMLAVAEPRLKLRTPYLAARIDNVGYSHLPNVLTGDPTSPSFYRDGGRVNYTGYQPQSPSYFPPTT